MKVAAIVPYHTGFCAGQRFRIELWAGHLRERGIEVEYYPFASPTLTGRLYTQGQTFQKGREMLRCYVEQLSRVLRASRPDSIYIYREAALIGPAWIERLTRRWKAPIIYDIDEPLFIPYVSPRNGRLNRLRFFSKVNTLLEMSDHVLAVNQAIGKYAERFAERVSIVPMAVDTERYSPAQKEQAELLPPRVGWVGTLTNQPNLELVAEPLRRLKESHGAILRVIADEPMTIDGVDVEFIPWAYDIEVPRLQECQIGIVPVKPSVWSPWKFFFKLIQYMSLGMAVVATPTGSNKEIIRDGENGFLADSDEEWYERLRTLMENEELRREMGRAARRTAEEHFSLARQIDFIEGVFQSNSVAN
ncbi:MAG: glycosyltransferase family 4 protein [Pyrinomonadaceae bacterium]|nr:glycosyltransferase family 4 protein [Pyrinomonadaceae bacterium]